MARTQNRRYRGYSRGPQQKTAKMTLMLIKKPEALKDKEDTFKISLLAIVRKGNEPAQNATIYIHKDNILVAKSSTDGNGEAKIEFELKAEKDEKDILLTPEALGMTGGSVSINLEKAKKKKEEEGDGVYEIEVNDPPNVVGSNYIVEIFLHTKKGDKCSGDLKVTAEGEFPVVYPVTEIGLALPRPVPTKEKTWIHFESVGKGGEKKSKGKDVEKTIWLYPPKKTEEEIENKTEERETDIHESFLRRFLGAIGGEL